MFCQRFSFSPHQHASNQVDECLDALLAIFIPTFTDSQQFSRGVSRCFVSNLHSYLHQYSAVEQTSVRMVCGQYSFLLSLIAAFDQMSVRILHHNFNLYLCRIASSQADECPDDLLVVFIASSLILSQQSSRQVPDFHLSQPIARSCADVWPDASLALSIPTFTDSQQLSRQVFGCFVGDFHSYRHLQPAIEWTNVRTFCRTFNSYFHQIVSSQADECPDASLPIVIPTFTDIGQQLSGQVAGCFASDFHSY